MTIASRKHRALKYTLARASEKLRNGQAFLMRKPLCVKKGDLNKIKKLAKKTTTDYITK